MIDSIYHGRYKIEIGQLLSNNRREVIIVRMEGWFAGAGFRTKLSLELIQNSSD